SSVFAHSGNVSFDVTGIQIRLIERRIQQLNEFMLLVHQPFIHGIHCPARSTLIRRAGQYGPTLRNRVDPALRITVGAKRRAVIEIGAAVPFPIPAVLLYMVSKLSRLQFATLGKVSISVNLS